MRLSFALLVLVGVSASCGENDPPPKALVELEGSCGATIECAKGLLCSTGRCAEPSNESEEKSVAVVKLERKIAETKRLEKAAYTEQGKQRMRDDRAKFKTKLAALRAE